VPIRRNANGCRRNIGEFIRLFNLASSSSTRTGPSTAHGIFPTDFLGFPPPDDIEESRSWRSASCPGEHLLDAGAYAPSEASGVDESLGRLTLQVALTSLTVCRDVTRAQAG